MTNKELFKLLVQNKYIIIKDESPNEIRKVINTILSIMDDKIRTNIVSSLRYSADDKIKNILDEKDFLIYEVDGYIRFGFFDTHEHVRRYSKPEMSIKTLTKLINLKVKDYDLLKLANSIKYDK